MRMWVKKIAMRGHSLCVTLPINYARHFDIKRGDFVFLKVSNDGVLMVEKFDPSKRPDLAVMANVEYDK